MYYDADVGVYYPAHNIVILYWFAGGIFMVAAGALMMGSSFNRLLHGRCAGAAKGADRALRDTVLAGCVTVLFFSFQSPEIVDRWLWLPFMLALCFRDAGPTGPVRDPRADPGLRARAGPGVDGRVASPASLARDGRASSRPAPGQRHGPDRRPEQEPS